MKLCPDLPIAHLTASGKRQESHGRLGSGVERIRYSERHGAGLAHGADPPADLDLSALRMGRKARYLCGARTPEWNLASGGALCKRAEGKALKGGLPDAKGAAVEADLGGPGAGALQRVERNPLQKGRLLSQFRPGLGDVPLGLRAELREGR
jgi:hypothetical protein